MLRVSVSTAGLGERLHKREHTLVLDFGRETGPASQPLHVPEQLRRHPPQQWPLGGNSRARAGNDGRAERHDDGRMTTFSTYTDREFVLGQDLRATVLTTAAETDGRHDLSECRQPAGGRTPLHLHTRYDERFWVVSGSLTIWAGADQVTLRSGDFYAIPMNTPHAIEAGPNGAHALQISSPAAFAELVARAGTPARLASAETELDMELFEHVTAELGDVILGPPGMLPSELPGSR